MSDNNKDDEIWNEKFVLTNEKWQKVANKAFKTWNNLKNVTKEQDHWGETKLCPMHPSFFFQLSQVRYFNQKNGYTYEEYVNNWKTKYNK